MNHISALDAASHKADNVDLYDVWEDTPSPIVPIKQTRKDLTHGRAMGNTWGYQSESAHSRKRLDKFFYPGLVEAQDLTGKVGRLGIGVKTKVEVWEYERTGLHFVKRRLVNGIYKSQSN